MNAAPPIVCLLTDYGLSDHYVGTLKGALLSRLPGQQIIDITHNIPAQDVRVAAFELLAAYRYQPHSALFICVVDPGVGSERGILYAEAGPWKFIAPDNGLLSWVFDETPLSVLVKIDPSRIATSMSSTFHGRDVIAPLAARILSGENPLSFGLPVKTFVNLPFPAVQKSGSLWKGEVLVSDTFGNLITNFKTSEVAPLAKNAKLWVEFEKNTFTIRGLSETYSSVEPGKLAAIAGSSGFIEIAVNQGSAATFTHLSIGDRVSLHFRA